MKRYAINLNEEIERIKSLFTEERMFGNLITEDVGTGVEEYTNILESKGFEEKTKTADRVRYYKIFNPYNIVKIKTALENNKPENVDINKIDFNRASLEFSVNIFFKNNAVTSWDGDIQFIADGKSIYALSEEKDKFVFSSKKTNDLTVESFKKQLDEVLVTDWFKSKAGTNPEFSTKKDAGDVKQQRKDDVAATKKEINMSKDECRDHMKDMYKQVRQGKAKEEFEKGDIDGVYFCMKNFYQTFEKEGLFRKGDEIRIMYKTLGLKPTENMVALGANDEEEITGDTFDDAKAEGGVEGERYVVKDKGIKIAIIRKVGGNKFNFRSKMNVPLVDKSDKGNIKFNKNYLTSIYKELNIDPNKQRIVIQKAVETDKMDVGTFVLTNV